ncbi:hypothetical protein HG530_009233 [Fusarium avenaceum]|nr:hypothetical protein HG530_009233 [Fusarium avenaceum]
MGYVDVFAIGDLSHRGECAKDDELDIGIHGCIGNRFALTDLPFIYYLIAAGALLGAAAGWYTSGAPLLINKNEIAYPTHKAIASACFQCGFYLSSIASAWVTFILLPALAFPGFFMAPESPRWLASVDRIQEAAAVITKHHANGDVDSPLVHFETGEITNTIKAEWRLLISVSLGVFSQRSGNGVVSYYLALVIQTVGITSVTHQTLISACLQVWNLIWGQQLLQ